MAESTTPSLAFPESGAKDVMIEILRQGAQRMLAQAIQEEVNEWINGRPGLCDAAGRQHGVGVPELTDDLLRTVAFPSS